MMVSRENVKDISKGEILKEHKYRRKNLGQYTCHLIIQNIQNFSTHPVMCMPD